MRTYAPRAVVRGDVLLFTATRGRLAGDDAVAAWSRYVDGEIHNYDVDCEHRDMGRLMPMARIGPLVAAHLSAADAATAAEHASRAPSVELAADTR